MCVTNWRCSTNDRNCPRCIMGDVGSSVDGLHVRRESDDLSRWVFTSRAVMFKVHMWSSNLYLKRLFIHFILKLYWSLLKLYWSESGLTLIISSPPRPRGLRHSQWWWLYSTHQRETAHQPHQEEHQQQITAVLQQHTRTSVINHPQQQQHVAPPRG